MDIENQIKEKYPLCYAAGVDGNEFRETELRNEITNACGRDVGEACMVKQIEILHKLNNGIELNSHEINACLPMMNLPNEHWKPIKDWEDTYLVSDKGRIKLSKTVLFVNWYMTETVMYSLS